MVSVGCQTDPNLIDRLVTNHNFRKIEEVDLYQEYLRSAQCAQFWPMDNNPIRSLVPSMIGVDLPEQHLKNESLMFDLAQAMTNNSKLVNLLAKYIHHIIPNVIICKRVDLIPLITCTIRVCRDPAEQDRLIGLLFNLIKRPNEEQRRMILSGIIVVLQVTPHQSSSLLLPHLWDHVNDKFPERRILLAESCATLAHYVRPVMRSNLILSILIQLLKDKNAAVRLAACKSFACLLSLIMDRNDEVFDACLTAADEIIQDVLQQTPVNFCEHRYELEQMRQCSLETVYPLLCMWAVKLNRFKVELAEFYLAKAEKCFASLANVKSNPNQPNGTTATDLMNPTSSVKAAAAIAVAKRRSIFFEGRHSSMSSSFSSGASSLLNVAAGRRRQSAFVANAIGNKTLSTSSSGASSSSSPVDVNINSAAITSQRAISAYLKMINYMIPFVFSDVVNTCAWLSKSKLNLPTATSSPTTDLNNNTANDTNNNPIENNAESLPNTNTNIVTSTKLFDRPIVFSNKLLEPTLIIDESAIVAFHDQLEQEMHMIESVQWILEKFLPQYLSILSYFSNKKFYSTINGTIDIMQEFLSVTISSIRQLCLLFGKHLTRTKIRPLIKSFIQSNNIPALCFVYIASLTSFEPIEQQEFEEIVLIIRQNLSSSHLTRNDVEILAISIRIIATNDEQIHSPSTRQKFLTYILDSLVSYSSQTRSKEYMLTIFRHILNCLIDPAVRPLDWAHILVTKFLPLIIQLANDSSDVYVCTYARLMCAQLVETFDTYLNDPKLTKQTADSIRPALNSLRILTEQIKASNLKRQIDCLTQNLDEKFFNPTQPQQQQPSSI